MKLKILKIFIISLTILGIVSDLDSKKTVRPAKEFKFLSCKCLLEPWYADEYIYKNWTCFAKNWNRYFSTVNMDFTLTKPLHKIFVRF